MSGKQRDDSIDLMKGILTFFMILSHIANVCSVGGVFSIYVNLTTFSGFMFCFGYVCDKAYIRSDKLKLKKLFLGFIKTIVAYYVSAFCWMFLWYPGHSYEILTQQIAASYSEFLLSWAYIYLIMVIRQPINKVIENEIFTLIAVLICIFMTYIPYQKITIPWLGPIIGSTSSCYFPLIQYAPYFIIGAAISRRKVVLDKPIFGVFLIMSVAFWSYYSETGIQPQRWGPSALWIGGGAVFVYAYYLICKYISSERKLKEFALIKWLNFIGKDSLLFLVISNLFLFSFGYIKPLNLIPNVYVCWVIYFMIVMIVCSLIVIIKHKLLQMVQRHQNRVK